METDFVWIVRGVVYTTESRRRQVFLSVFSGLSSTVFSFIYQDNLLNHGIVKSKEMRELCMHLVDSATEYIKIMRHV